MKIWIDDVCADDSRKVTFSSPAGHATAVWGEETLPQPGENDVELEIAATLRWGEDVRAREGASAGLEQTQDGYRLTGRAVSLESDGMLVLDVGGSIVMIETEGGPPDGVGVGSIVELRTARLELYPTSI